ncbi:MAG: nucleotidyltransferase domain-containing protein [ANME-2 cluster archaeon]|nr:nucleotidyltransferase domain-containing protein [ANME-2 cluster archaeon]
MRSMIGKIDDEINETIEVLKSFDSIHSIILFGSRARGVQGKDIDLCIIPSKELDLRERLSIESIVPDNVDISVFFDLPIHIRKRIFEEGHVLHTREMYYVLTLLKENDFEYSDYKRHREYYNSAMKERMKKKVSKN